MPRNNVVALGAAPALDAPPAILKGEALAEWKRVVPMLRASGATSALDRGVLSGYCQAWARWLDAETQIAASSVLLARKRGKDQAAEPVISPWFEISNRAMEQVARLGDQLGLTPIGRSRIKAKDPGTPPVEDWIARRQGKPT